MPYRIAGIDVHKKMLGGWWLTLRSTVPGEPPTRSVFGTPDQ